ncbi:hypothetical protein PPL_05613 [Heterostelium album PN500]|uniref:UBR-type domain-containing protein n=1 Tax=Heterostelium pallidum (strain ATCC 26659 / Pp 5 / PN500) TaxID=670386 RepID=D3BAN5_HETP5|nr:hypothetical protein PPL_05613 [Heterostelium album PN500]EFA81622.1 hypothetical protein PPL_05613 [Heterostelium album PN500]|eukprot:XP_020433739.1 hypothetical protein PPL_05613 [Heterostelium album PN500]
MIKLYQQFQQHLNISDSPQSNNKRKMGYYTAEETEQLSKQYNQQRPRRPDTSVNEGDGDHDRRLDFKKATETATDIESASAFPNLDTEFQEGDSPHQYNEIHSQLSDENWIDILQYLDHKSLVALSEVSHSFNRLSNDRFNRRDFNTLTDALSALVDQKRETILIGPGLYKENISIDKPVDILGEKDVVIESSSSNTVSISAAHGSITNVSMRQTGHWFCIDIEKGGFTINKCDITNTTLSAIKIGKHASPWITDNIIHDCKEAGIAIFGGEGTIIGNRFTRNRYGSIEIVYSTAKPTIKLNRIYRNKGYGIHVHTNAGGIITENIIEENESDGISCWGGASPVVSNNKICYNLEDGIYIHEDGKGVYEHNQIYGQKLDGIRISKSNPQISHNTIHHNQGDGIRLVIKANPIITENHICENKRVGIHIYREGMGLVSNNYIYGNKNAGMQVYSRANTTICNNKIIQNRCSGIYISDHAIVNIKGNEIANNGEVGVEIVSGSKALVFDNNQISRNWEAGLAYYTDSKPIGFESNNTFTLNGENGNQQYILREGRELMTINSLKSKSKSNNDEMEPISFLVENALQVGLCTLSYTREYYHAQYWYECKTCTEPRKILGRSEIAVCEECAKKCHAGHDIGMRKYGHFYCDCGQQVASPCKCVSNINRPKAPSNESRILYCGFFIQTHQYDFGENKTLYTSMWSTTIRLENHERCWKYTWALWSICFAYTVVFSILSIFVSEKIKSLYYTIGFIVLCVYGGGTTLINGMVLIRQMHKHEEKTIKEDTNHIIHGMVRKVKYLSLVMLVCLLVMVSRTLVFYVLKIQKDSNLKHVSSFITFCTETITAGAVMIAIADCPNNYWYAKPVMTVRGSNKNSTHGGHSSGGSFPSHTVGNSKNKSTISLELIDTDNFNSREFENTGSETNIEMIIVDD